MTEESYRIVDLYGTVSEDPYTMEEPPNNKHIAILIDKNGGRVRVHSDRLLPADVTGKAVPLQIDGTVVATCPACRERSPVQVEESDVQFIQCTCPRGKTLLVSTTVRRADGTKLDNNNEDDAMASEVATPALDFEQIKAYGSELWQKAVSFDHPTVGAVAYALLASDPDRKLCFQTYNGQLGKKTPGIARLHLEEFRDHQPVAETGKYVGHLVKHGLEKERDKLAKAGYRLL